MREILPTAEVWRGSGGESVLPQVPQDLGGIAFERYFNGMSERTLHLLQSVAKSVTGAAAGCLVALGVLDPARPLTHYLRELAATAYQGATMQHVLDMTSGVSFNEDYTDAHSDVGRIDVASGWKPPPDVADDLPEHMRELVLSLKLPERPHGERVVYRSIETDVLGFCMERASNKRLPQLVSELLWQPMGAAGERLFHCRSRRLHACRWRPQRQLAGLCPFRFALSHGVFNGHQIMPASWIKATQTGDHALFGEALYAADAQWRL